MDSSAATGRKLVHRIRHQKVITERHGVDIRVESKPDEEATSSVPFTAGGGHRE